MEHSEVPKKFRRAVFCMGLTYAFVALPLIPAGILWDYKYRSSNGILFAIYTSDRYHSLVEQVYQPNLFWPGFLIITQVIPAFKVQFTRTLKWVLVHFMCCFVSSAGIIGGTAISAQTWLHMQNFDNLGTCIRRTDFCICSFWDDKRTFAEFSGSNCDYVLPWYQLISVFFAFSCLCCVLFVFTTIVSLVTCIKVIKKSSNGTYIRREETPALISNVSINGPYRTPPPYSRVPQNTNYGATMSSNSRAMGLPPPYEAVGPK